MIRETFITEIRQEKKDSFGETTYFKLRKDRKYIIKHNDELQHFEVTECEATEGTLYADNSRYIRSFTENELNEYTAKVRAEVEDRILDIIREGEATDIGRRITIERIYVALKGADA